MISVLAAPATKLAELKSLGRRLFVFRRRVITTLAFGALKHNIIARHNLVPYDFKRRVLWDESARVSDLIYSTTSVIVPAPTVRPPSRMAKRNPFSIAIGVINSTSI